MPSTMDELLIIILLVLLNGVFAMSEIAMVSSRKSRFEAQAKKGEKTSIKALELSRNLSKFLSTVQIGITLVGILMGIYSGEKFAARLKNYLDGFEWISSYSDTLAVTFVVIGLTFLSLVFGELVPKRIGLTRPETITRILAYPMYIISLIAAPFIWLLTFTTELLFKILNIKKSNEAHITEEEIKAIIQEATETGTVQEIEQEILENVFHLGDRKINTLMTPRSKVEWLDTEASEESTKASITSSYHKSFPVCKNNLDQVMGVLHAKDLLDALLLSKPFQITALLKPPLFLSEDTTAYAALEELRESRQQIAIVLDKDKEVKGILSMHDLIETLTGDFIEELHEKEEIIPRDDGSFLVDASLPFPEFARYFELAIFDEDELSNISTVAELIEHFGTSVPVPGFKFEWKKLKVEILDMDGKKIDKVLVNKII
jgi:putative hemolysin